MGETVTGLRVRVIHCSSLTAPWALAPSTPSPLSLHPGPLHPRSPQPLASFSPAAAPPCRRTRWP